MKKTVLIAVLGVATAASTYAQGYITFSSYAQTVQPYPIATAVGSGTPLDSTFTAQLYYFLGTVADPVNPSDNNSITSAPTGLTAFLGANTVFATSGASTPGFFDGAILTIPGYSSGAITFEVVAFNGADYASSAVRGRSGSFTMTSIRTDGIGSAFGDNGTPMPTFLVAPVPEPTTLALAGLGGLASLVAFRRKQA